MLQSFVGLIDGLMQLVEERCDLLAGDIHILQGRPDNRAILVQHAVKIRETRGNVLAILIVEQVVDTSNGGVQLFNAVIEIGEEFLGLRRQLVDLLRQIVKAEIRFGSQKSAGRSKRRTGSSGQDFQVIIAQ